MRRSECAIPPDGPGARALRRGDAAGWPGVGAAQGSGCHCPGLPGRAATLGPVPVD